MTKEQRVAIARIISDMIKADNIIEESEIFDMKQINEAYHITREDMIEARHTRFSESVNTLGTLSKRTRQELFDQIYHLAMSDGLCVPKEVLLLVALKYCLTDIDGIPCHKRPYLISCPTGEGTLSEQYMVYLESSFDEARNEEIKNNFPLLLAYSKLSGFNFIYIPLMVEEFKKMNSRYVKDVIGYMSPSLEETKIDEVYSRLCSMTTQKFFKEVLYENLKVRMDYNTPPSLLINIGSSLVPYSSLDGSIQYYTEFLCIPLGEKSIFNEVNCLLKFYQSKVSIKTITITDNPGQFKYFGFYKALFDFIIAEPPESPKLIFGGLDMRENRYYVTFRFTKGHESKLYLSPSYYDLYLSIAKATYGNSIGGYSSAKVNKPNLSKLRKILEKKLKDLNVTFSDQYWPEKDGNLYKLRLDREKIFIRDSCTGTETTI